MSGLSELYKILNNDETKVLDDKNNPVQYILDMIRLARQEYMEDKLSGNFPAMLMAEVNIIQDAEQLAVNLSCRTLEPGVHIVASANNKYEALRERIKE